MLILSQDEAVLIRNYSHLFIIPVGGGKYAVKARVNGKAFTLGIYSQLGCTKALKRIAIAASRNMGAFAMPPEIVEEGVKI